ncbi:MAG TPA: hypothetical protein VGM90_36925 [Kofleriaceae bacterium]
MTRTLFTASSLLLISLAACGGGSDPATTPTASTVRTRISSDLKNVLDQAVAANDGATAKLNVPGFLGGFFGSTSVSTSGGSAVAPDDPTDTFDTQQIIDELDEQVFTDANEVEPGIYAIPASLVCGDPVDDPECAPHWADVGMRVRVTESGSTLRFSVQIGADHDEPLSVALTSSSLAVSVDLDDAESAIQTVATALGEQAPTVDLAGAVTATLDVLGASHVALDLNVDRDLSVAVADQGESLTGPTAFHFATKAAHGLHLDLDGNAQTGALAIAVGATTLSVPDDTDSFGLDLPGATASATLTDGQIAVTNISLGDHTTRVTHNGATAYAIDLNPDNGRKLDATLTADATTGATLSVQPAFDLRIATDHSVIGDTIENFDVTRVLLTGALHGDEDSGQIKVTTGSLSIETDPAGHGVTASAGQCVTSEDVYDDATYSSYTTWTAGPCL